MKLGLFALAFCIVAEAELLDEFISDIIREWQLRLPTIVGEEYLPEMCRTHGRVLCLSNDVALDELAEHMALIHLNRNQDGVIFLGEGHEQVIEKVTRLASTIWRSNCPVFMPLESSNEINLRLDSNIIFYEEHGPNAYRLVDIFAVKSGPPIRIELGNWVNQDGFSFKSQKNRWKRRTDLKGATFINGLLDYGTWAELIKDDAGNVIGSSGYFQDMLFYIIQHLNLKVEHREIPNEKLEKLENGSWTGDIGVLQRKEADVCSAGIGIKIERSSAIEYPMPTYRDTVTLIAANSQGTAINMWAYLEVFGVTQWCIFIALLFSFVAIDTIFYNLSQQNPHSPHISSAITATITAFLFTIQLGENNVKNLGKRMLTLTISMMTLLMFVYYTTDITAEMTSGPPGIPIRNFEDVIHYKYTVFAKSSYLSSFLADAPPGSAKNLVHEMYFEQVPSDIKPALKLKSEPKSLWYTVSALSVPSEKWDLDRDELSAYDELHPLKMDDESYAYATLALQKDSEFLELFNYYILKEYEHGILKKLFHTYYTKLYTREQFSMSEPQPLGYESVLFTFSCLGLGATTSLGIAIVELIAIKWYRNHKLPDRRISI